MISNDTIDVEIKSEKLTEEEKLKKEIEICLEWLKEQKITKTINKKRTSYALKHCVEEWYEERYGKHKYISSDAVVYAIIKLGIPFQIAGSDVFAAISIKKRNESSMASTLFKRY